MNKFQNIFCILAVLAFGMLGTGCSTEDSQVEVPEPMGILCLNMSSDEVYVQAGTRAVQTLTDWSGYQFTLDNGSTSTPLVFTDGRASVAVGTYTLSATNSASVDNGYGGALYSGAETFSINAGEQKAITLALGKPKNSKVTVSLSSAFAEKYELKSLTLNDGTRDITISSVSEAAYFPTSATQLTYTLVADAKAGSLVQDITSATGSVTIDAGKHTTLNLQINPIDPNLVVIDTDTDYNGEFQ
jgi:hypothetical protein